MMSRFRPKASPPADRQRWCLRRGRASECPFRRR